MVHTLQVEWILTIRRACHAPFWYELKEYRYVLFCRVTTQTLFAGQGPDIRTDVFFFVWS